MLTQEIQLGEISVDVVLKDIKNIHLSVHPPTGRVRIAAPAYMNLDTIRVYAIAKIDWIKKQQGKFQEQQRETQREYLERESHYIWGRRYLLEIKEEAANPGVELNHSRMILSVRPGSSAEKKAAVMAAWYRNELRNAATPLIAKWEPVLGVNVAHCYIQRMKTRWGSCNPHNRNIRLNTELAKKPRECVEYVLVHEMAHLLEPSHNDRFAGLMNQFMPQWRHLREELNQAPLGFVEWGY